MPDISSRRAREILQHYAGLLATSVPPPSNGTLAQRVNKSLKTQLPGVEKKVLGRGCPSNEKSKELCCDRTELVEQIWNPPFKSIPVFWRQLKGMSKITWQKWSISISGNSCSQYLLDYLQYYSTVITFKLIIQWIFKNHIFEYHKVSLVSSLASDLKWYVCKLYLIMDPG